MNTLIESIGFSICNPKKKKCGDAFFSGIITLNNEECWVLMVADGVSKSPKDWLASKSTIEFVIEYLKSHKAEFSKLISCAVNFANNKLYEGVEETYGMLSTLSILIYVPTLNSVYFTNVGDSRIYAISKEKTEQISLDDTVSVPIYENGKIKCINGLPIWKNPITKAIGTNQQLELKIEMFLLDNWEGFCLATDGMYSISCFENNVKTLIESHNLYFSEEKIKQVIKSKINDDASLSLIRFINIDEKVNLKTLLDDEKNTLLGISKAKISKAIENEIEQMILNKENDFLLKTLLYMQKNDVLFSKEKMIAWLELSIKNKAEHQQFLISMIRNIF